jgi:glycosyltransferase involved in cell wall biosynthesis
MFQPKLTVITIVYNNVHDIERTVLSVLNQSYANIEYLLIDGASNDGTLEILMQYEGRIGKLVSDRDKGIYDAMNKGLSMATGDYVLFMNSGDEIYASDSVEKIFATEPDADIYYGETEMFDENWNSLGQRRHRSPEHFTWRDFKFGMCISHQSIYIRRALTVPYDLNYQLSSDIDWIIKAAKKAKKIVNVRMYVAKYLVGGMSKKKHRQSLVERFHIFSKHYGLIPTIFNHALIAGKLGLYYLKHRKTND